MSNSLLIASQRGRAETIDENLVYLPGDELWAQEPEGAAEDKRRKEEGVASTAVRARIRMTQL